jgi:uncharacterized protein
MFEKIVTSVGELRELLGEPSPNTTAKSLPDLDPHARAFLALSPFALLATSGADGTCDVSPRGDAPGFTRVVDRSTIVLPERPGNRRLDSLVNVLANPQVGLLFLVPGVGETLRVNGRASIVRDPDLLASFAVGGRPALVALAVRVEEVFLHCQKAFRRSALWRTDTWPEPDALPTMGRMLVDQLRLEMSAEEMDADLDLNYEHELY